MGCIHSKSSAVDDSRENPKERVSSSNRVAELNDPISRLGSSRREKVKSGGDVSVMLIDRKVNASSRQLYADHHHHHQLEKKTDQIEKQRRERAEAVAVDDNPRAGRVPKAAEGEQVAAGWPAWLSAVAGEAINGWLPRKANTFEKLDKIGQGTYSSVYRARDVVHNKIVAIKKIRFDNMDPESVKFMCREIIILRRLDHPNIIKLEGMITSPMSCSLYLVFEYMEHDLTGLAARPGVKFTEPQIKCYMQQLLSGLEHCHKQNILHRDIKGSNLLIDNNGILKIADFGLASFFDPHHKAPLTSRVVTLWYRPPELLLGASHYGVEVDMWSTGCILGELYTSKPILPGKTEVEQLHKIFKLCGSPSEDYWRKLHLPHSAVFKPPHPYRRCITEAFKEVPPAALGLMETLLSVDPGQRGSATLALSNEFFTTSPLPCDPSSLPKYPPSKEIDAKLREEESRRRGAAGAKDQSSERKVPGEIQSNAGYNHYSTEQMQARQSHSSSKSRSEVYGSHQDKTISGFLVGLTKEHRGSREPTRKDLTDHPSSNRASFSGPLVPGPAFRKGTKDHDHSSTLSSRSNLSNLSSLVASRTVLSGGDNQERSDPSEARTKVGRCSGPINGMEPLRRQDSRYHVRRNADAARPVDDGKVGTKESTEHCRESGANHKIYLSGPLVSSNVDHMLKDHDRRIQEYARRARNDKSRAQGRIASHDQVYLSRQVPG